MDFLQRMTAQWNRIMAKTGMEIPENAKTEDEILDHLEQTTEMQAIIDSRIDERSEDSDISDKIEAFETKLSELHETVGTQGKELTGKIEAIEKGLEEKSEAHEKEFTALKAEVKKVKGIKTGELDNIDIKDRQRQENGDDDVIEMSFEEFRNGKTTKK